MPSKLYGATSILAGLLLIINTSYLSASANDGGQFSALRLVGNVFCDTCFQQQFSEKSYFMSGASVAVQCRINKQQKPDFRIEAKTNENGEFKVELPRSIFHSHEQVKRCSAKLLKNPRGSCNVASMAKPSSFSLKSKQGGIYTYSAGSFTYRPPSLPALCSKDASQTATLSSFKKGASFKVSSVSGSSVKPSSQLPPLLPPLSSNFPPLPPLLPPPSSILPPLPPLLPQPSSIFPPLPTIPPFPFPVPPLPFLTPSPPPPPPPPPPILPFPTIPPLPITFPPFPFLTPSPPPPPPVLPFPTIPPLPITVPPLPFLTPSPPPPLFNLPPLPFPLPPNPFQPPPAPLIPLPPNPFLPPPPLIPLPPNPFLPPPPLIPLPPNPLLPPPPLIPLPPLIPVPPIPFIPPAQHTLPTTP